MYYSLIIALENIIYAHRPPRLAAISRKTKDDVLGRWKRDDQIPIVYGGLDFRRFNPERQTAMRSHARRELGLSDDLFVLLMIGNDWKKKGLETLLKAMGRLPIPRLRLIVAGKDSMAPYTNLLITHDLADRLIFLPIRSDVEFYYAAADAYICPSLEDASRIRRSKRWRLGCPSWSAVRPGLANSSRIGWTGSCFLTLTMRRLFNI